MIDWIKNIAVVLFLFNTTTSVWAQSRSQLEDERNRIIEQIEKTSENLKKTSSNKKATLKDLQAVESQIRNRKKLIENIQEQLKNTDKAIANNTNRIESIDDNIKELDEQYKLLARNMYLRTLAGSKWAYIFSASSMNDAFLRWRYSKQYEAYVAQRTDRMFSLKGSINDKNQSIQEEKTYIETLLADEKKNYKSLEKDLKKKDEILAQLKKEESSLKKNLAKKKSQREKLNNEIEKIILTELSKSKPAETATYSAIIQKKKLEWPAKGYVSSKFGKQAHPSIKNLKINNNGIDITCRRSAPVSAIADGKVISVTTIAGYDYMVIVQHGDYYSVYSKIAHIIVKNGETIRTGQTIGRLKDEESPELHFEIWNQKKKLNPENWLK